MTNRQGATTNGCSALSLRDLEMFAGLGITPELLAAAGVERVDDQEARDKYGVRGSRSRDMSGIAFPYLDPITGARTTARVRLDNTEPEVEGADPPPKYINPWGDTRHLYFPPGAGDKLEDAATPIALVESEKAALSVTEWARRTGTNLVAIALGGCYGWLGSNGRTTNARGKTVSTHGPLSDLDRVDGHKIYVLLDSDAVSNRQVKKARSRLVGELKKRSEEVLVCTLPLLLNVNGPDDYLGWCLANGTGDAGMAQIFAEAQAAVAYLDYGGGRFELGDDGVVYIGPPNKEGHSCPPVWICAPLRVLAQTRDSRSGAWGRLLEWSDRDQVTHQWAMPMELLQRDGGVEARCELARQGLAIALGRGARELFAAYVQMWPVDSRARCVERLGWHGSVYVLPAEAVGASGERIVFQNAHAIEPAFAITGAVEDWREHVGSHLRGNSRLVFCVACGFAGPLLDIVGDDSGGFHLRGPSSSGKTTGLKLAASVWGPPACYCRLWRATSNGLEGLAALHSDGLLILDELGQLDPREAGESSYLLANGRGKTRATRVGTARQAASWRLLFLSAGEESLSALMARIKRAPTAGQELRLADIEADAGQGMGMLEDLRGHETATALVTALKDAAARYYGAVGAQFLRQVVRGRLQLAEELAAGVRQFVKQYVAEDTSGQVERVARRFGLVAMAGEIATRYRLTGWEKGESIEAAGKCFTSWQESFGGTAGRREERGLLAHVRGFFETHGASRFENMLGHTVVTKDSASGEYRVAGEEHDKSQKIINRAGFFEENDGTRTFLVFPETFQKEICAGFDSKFAIKVLKEHGWIIPDNSGKTAQNKRLPGFGATTRVYVFDGAKMWKTENEAASTQA